MKHVLTFLAFNQNELDRQNFVRDVHVLRTQVNLLNCVTSDCLFHSKIHPYIMQDTTNASLVIRKR